MSDIISILLLILVVYAYFGGILIGYQMGTYNKSETEDKERQVGE